MIKLCVYPNCKISKKFPPSKIFSRYGTCRELLYMYHTWKVIKQTQGRQYTIICNGFLNRNVLNMPVPAGIFAMNKSIANFRKLLDEVVISTIFARAHISTNKIRV